MCCRCPNGFGAEPNTQTCPVCLAFPGALPVPNRRAIEETIKLGLALDCEIAERAVFHRKNYFYPDNPKAYQISQYDEPLCVGGRLSVPTEAGNVEVGIVRAHLEEDAAKSVHVAASGRIHGATATLVDFNRCGTPLLEIVTQPDIHSADVAKRFLKLLQQTVVELGISDAELEKGTMRFDINVSVRPAGSSTPSTEPESSGFRALKSSVQSDCSSPSCFRCYPRAALLSGAAFSAQFCGRRWSGQHWV